MKTIYIFLAIITFSVLSINTSAQAPNTWTQKANFGGSGRCFAVGFSIGAKGYIGTGFDNINGPWGDRNDFWEYDTTINTWTQKANFGGTPRDNAVGFSIGSKGYIGTGFDGTYRNDFWEYDPTTNTWTQKANFGGTPRYGAVGFSIGSKGYIGTGEIGTPLTYYNDFWEYDTSANTWTQKANFGGAARSEAVGFSIGSKGFIGTGSTFSSFSSNDFWEYDPTTNTWTQKANFGGFARGYAVGFNIGANGYIGTGTGPGGFYNDFWEYDTTANTWTQKANFGGAVRCEAVGFSIGSKGFIGTGTNGPVFYNDFWKYTPGGCTLPSAPSNTTPIGNQTICSGNFTALSASGTGTLGWYNAASGGNWLGGGTTFTTPVLTSNTIYYVQDSNSCGANPNRTSIAVTVNPLPYVTNSPLSQTICSGTSTTLVTLTSNVSGTTFNWTATATPGVTGFQTSGTNTIPIQTISTSVTTQGTVTYAIIPTAAGCSGSVTNYTILVNPLPNPAISGPSPVCAGSTGNIYLTQAGMSGYTWTVSSGGIITSGGGTNAITVTWNQVGSQTVSVNYTNSFGCTATSPTVYNVTVNPFPVPTITGSTSLCVNSGYNNYTTEAGMQNYMWTISSGGIINYGSGTNQISVSWIASGNQTVSVTYTSQAGCNAASPTVLNVTVNPYPYPAGPISGSSNVCPGANNIAYSVTPINNATSYVWALPPGASIASGAGTNSITVDFSSNASSGIIFVWGNNLCGSGSNSPPFSVTVDPLPGSAGPITGPSDVCTGTTGVVYSVEIISYAAGYDWTVPTGVVITSGNNTHIITTDFSSTAVSGNITVQGTNSCGTGTVSPDFFVTVKTTPPIPVVTNTGDTLHSSSPTGNQWYFEGNIILGATSQEYIATQDGYYWDLGTLNGCTSDTSNHKLIIITGINTHPGSIIIIYPVPNTGEFNVTISTNYRTSFNICIYNSLGVKIYEDANVAVDDIFQKVIDLRPVPYGVYTIIFENNQGVVVKNIVVVGK